VGSRLKPWAGVMGALFVMTAGGLLARTQNDSPSTPPATSEGPAENAIPTIQPPPQSSPATTAKAPSETPNAAAGSSPAPATLSRNSEADQNAEAVAPEGSAETKGPVEPPKVVRSPVAILQALDKVTAETMRFAAPVGRQVRYKGLLITVKACETRDIDSAQPQASAYLVVTSAPQIAPAGGPLPTKQIFHGWMFAQAPGLNALDHPIYDAWLIACSAASPAN
jgi:hypothetical protein